LRQIFLALKPGGRAAIWSACPDAVLEKRLKQSGFTVEAVPAKLYPNAKRAAYMIYLADKPLEVEAAKEKRR
jgi:hypothetical protein